MQARQLPTTGSTDIYNDLKIHFTNFFCFSLFQTLNSISAEKNSTIIFPLPIDLLTHFISGGGSSKGKSKSDSKEAKRDWTGLKNWGRHHAASAAMPRPPTRRSCDTWWPPKDGAALPTHSRRARWPFFYAHARTARWPHVVLIPPPPCNRPAGNLPPPKTEKT